ncbi:MAG: histidine phosphatase family protein [Caldilineaceae bacterium]
MLTTEFILVRHGETIWNAEARMQGQQDSPLTARGKAQAQAVARRLADVPFDHIYASDLQRVVDTAEPLAVCTNRQIIIEPQLRERHYGVFEGLTYADMERKHGELYQRYQTERYDADFIIPEAETIRQLVERGVAIFQSLAERHQSERIVVFSHGGTLSAVLRSVLGVPLGGKHGFRLENGSISMIAYSDHDWRVVTLGEVNHLQGID